MALSWKWDRLSLLALVQRNVSLAGLTSVVGWSEESVADEDEDSGTNDEENNKPGDGSRSGASIGDRSSRRPGADCSI